MQIKNVKKQVSCAHEAEDIQQKLQHLTANYFKNTVTTDIVIIYTK